MTDNKDTAVAAQRARDASRVAEQLEPPAVASFVAGVLRRYANALDNGHDQGRHLWEPMVDDLLAGGEGGDQTPTDNDRARASRTLHVTTNREIPEGHTNHRVRYQFEGESWEGWIISTARVGGVHEAYVMRDDGERWVVMARNLTDIPAPAAVSPAGGQ